MKRPLTFATLALGALVRTSAMELHVNFNDLVSNSHVILTGTCVGTRAQLDPERSGIVGSTAYFTDLEVIRTLLPGAEPNSDTLAIAYLGGSAEGVNMFICDMPHFEIGQRYLLFLLNDGNKYVTPLIGGAQGQFRLLRDEVTGEEYVLDAAGFALVQFDMEGIQKTPRPIERVHAGLPRFLDVKGNEHEIDRSGDAEGDEFPILSLSTCADRIRNHVFPEPSMNEWHRGAVPMPSLSVNPEPGPKKARPAEVPDERGLGACMYQDVYLSFEQNDAEPGFSSWAALDDYGKAIWDVHMNIYSDDPNPTNGWSPNNGSCEIAGWLTSAQTLASYDFAWGPTTLAMTSAWATSSNCGGEIVEADIMFNPAFSWTTDFASAFGTYLIPYRPTIVHEFGHTWGYQTDNTHLEISPSDYGQPSVMHSYRNWIWEDGKEIHSKDAAVIRVNYDDQTTIRDVDDVGVESYKAVTGTGLVNSYPNHTVVASGDDVKIYNVTVENNSDDPQNYVHERFYLSTNRTLSSGDPLVGDFALGTMAAVSRSTTTRTISTVGVPSGTYYVAIKVSINGYGTDDRSANDVTWSTYTIEVGGVGMEEQLGVAQLAVFPNPTQGTLTITLPEGVVDLKLVISDASGRVLQTISQAGTGLSSALEIDMEAYPLGVYVAMLTAQDGHRYVARMVRN